MKSFLFATVAVVALSSAAVAADAVIGDAALPVASTYNWTGAYVGAAVGYNWLSLKDVDYDDKHYTDGGFSGALYAGYNHQIDNWVLGIEADVRLSAADVPEDPAYITYDSRWAASLRGRLGFAADQFMPFVTGGLAVASFRGDHADDGTDLATSTVAGYVVGAGVDWAATQNIIVRAEYLFSNYGTNGFEFSGNDVHDVNMRTHDLRVGVAYKF
ncbi:MAG: outer membrane protein [Mesorhizobium sp.]|jgi:outer membrane immunogenic protein